MMSDDETASDTARLGDLSCRGVLSSPSPLDPTSRVDFFEPEAEATADVVMDRRGTLNSFEMELNMERATPTPASSTEPTQETSGGGSPERH